MEPYITNIAGKEAIFTEDGIKIGHLVLPFNEMSNVKFRKGAEQGFLFDYKDRNVFIPCPEEEKDAMMHFFAIVALRDRERQEEEERRRKEEEERRRQEEELLRKQREEQDALDTLDFLTVDIIDTLATPEVVENTEEDNTEENTLEEESPQEELPQEELPQEDMPQNVIEDPIREDPMTVEQEPSIDSFSYDENSDDTNNIVQTPIEPDLSQLQEIDHGFMPQNMQQENINPENIPLDILQSVDPSVDQQVDQQIDQQVDQPEPIMKQPQIAQQNIVEPEPMQQSDIFRQMPQQVMAQPTINQNNQPAPVNDKPIKPFWSVGRLVMGIISMVLCGLIVFESCAAGLSNALAENDSLSGSVGLFLSIFMLAGGIVGAATRKSVKKGGCMASSILYLLGAAFGGLEWNSTFEDLQVWVVVSLIFSLFYMFCAIMTKNPTKSKKPIIGYVIWGLILALTVGGIALSKTDSTATTTPSTDTNVVTEESTTPTEESQPIEYKEVTAAELLKTLDENAMNAEGYEGQYLAITGQLLTVDSDGSYITIDADDEVMTLDSIQCNIKTDEQKNKIKELKSGDKITVKGKMIAVGEIMGYELDIDSIE